MVSSTSTTPIDECQGLPFWQNRAVQVVIVGCELPGRSFCAADGTRLDDVHVGVQIGAQAEQLVSGDAASARWVLDVKCSDNGGSLDFKGPAVHGKRGERFLYLTWGDLGPAGEFAMFRRAKLMLNRIDPVLVEAAAAGQGPLVARVRLTDDKGDPRCARVDPPAVEWTLG